MSAVKKKKYKKRRRRRIAALFLIVLVAAGIILSTTVFFNIQEVVVEGELTRYTAQQIVTMSSIEKGGNLFRLGAKQREADLWAALPYIESIQIRRRLPGTVVIEVTEASSLLSVHFGNEYLIVSDSLKILEITRAPYDGMIEISGLKPVEPAAGKKLILENGESVEFLTQLIAALDQRDMMPGVNAIDLSDKLNYTMTFDNRFFVMIGTAHNLDFKMSMLDEAIHNSLTESDTGYIDLSVAGRATFRYGDYLTGPQEDVPGAEEENLPGEDETLEQAPQPDEEGGEQD